MNSTQGQSQATRSSAPPYLALIALTSCAGHQQSMVDPGGPQAGRILTLWWFFFSLLAAIFIVVVGFTLWTLLLRRPGATDQELLETQHKPSPETDNKMRRIVTGATIAMVVILFVLLVSSVGTGKAVSDLPKHNSMTIEVTGNQWWWQIR